MKRILFLTTVSFVSFMSQGQSFQDKEAVKNVVISFQDGFNNGSLKDAASYTTNDWEHINPLGGINKGRDSVLKIFGMFIKRSLKELE